MASKKPLYEIPVPSTDFLKESTFVLPLGLLKYAYSRDGVVVVAGLRFHRIIASCVTSEAACTTWQIEGVYDTLAEVEGSPWVTKLTQQIPDHIKEGIVIRHFMIYLDSSGCVEVVCGGWELLAEENEVGQKSGLTHRFLDATL